MFQDIILPVGLAILLGHLKHKNIRIAEVYSKVFIYPFNVFFTIDCHIFTSIAGTLTGLSGVGLQFMTPLSMLSLGYNIICRPCITVHRHIQYEIHNPSLDLEWLA